MTETKESPIFNLEYLYHW